MQSDDEMQLLRQLYMTMLRALRHQYLDNLLEMQALCTLLCSMHSSTQASLLKLTTAHMLVEAALGYSVAHHCQGFAQHLIAVPLSAATGLEHAPAIGWLHTHLPPL